MARTPYNDPEAEKQYQDASVDNKFTKMAGEVKPWPYSQQDVNITRASSDIVRQIKGPNPEPAKIINFPIKKK